MRHLQWVTVLSLVGIVAGQAAAGPPTAMSSASTTVTLAADSTAIVPGGTVEVAVVFQLAKGWHIYWRNPGTSGKPPTVEWKLPPGFTMGPLQFPGPQRHVEAGGLIVTNILEGTPILTATLAAPSDYAGTVAEIEGTVSWLACMTQCVPGSAHVKLSLPVVQSAAEVKPDSEAVFTAVKRTHPATDGRAAHVTVTASAPDASLTPGATFDLVVTLVVDNGFFIGSNAPGSKRVIATTAYAAAPKGLEPGTAKYPAGTDRDVPLLGRLSTYDGQVEIRIPVTVGEEAVRPPAALSGVVQYHVFDAHNNESVAMPYVAWEVTVRGAGQEPPANAGSGKRAVESVPAVPTGATEDAASPPGMPATGNGVGDGAAHWLERFLTGLGLPGLLLGCFLYGLMLNATPCVFPVLTIKILGFVQQAHESRRRTFVLGLAFGAGVVLFFVILGLLASRGQNVLQYPAAVIALGAIVMALALSLLGVYTLRVPTAATKLDATIQQEGLLASFGKGTLAPVLGFACTGPMLAGVFGWATQQPPQTAIVAFLVTGLGMASPYMLLGANPNWLSFLPKPGPWMITFERIMGFALLAMVLWLTAPLVTQVGPTGFQWTLLFFVVIAMACWVLGKVSVTMSPGQIMRYRGEAVGLVLVGGFVIFGLVYPLGAAQDRVQSERAEIMALRAGVQLDDEVWDRKIPWRPWSPGVAEAAARSGKTVFVDFTAAYCTICKKNKFLATNTPEVRRKMKELGVVPLQGDFSTHDADIAAVLERFGRPGVPLNLIYPAGRPDEPILLDPSFSKQYLLDLLDQAGPSRDTT